MPFARLLAGILAITLTTTSCGLLGATEQSQKAPAGSNVELYSINVMLCCGALDVAPFYLAHDRGYFADEGITTVNISTANNGGIAVDSVISGDVHIAFASYTPFIAAHAAGAADLKLVADATSLAPDNTVIVAKHDSPIRNITDLEGARIAVTATNTMTHFLALSAITVNNIDPDTIEWVSIGFRDMAAALQRGDIDAAVMTEPFRTQAMVDAGANQLYDTSHGPTEDMPIGGYGALESFASKYPRTVAAVQRALARAVQAVSDNYRVLRPIILDHGKIEGRYVDLLSRTHYQTSLEPKRLQRVPDLMGTFGALTERFEISDMIIPHATPS